MGGRVIYGARRGTGRGRVFRQRWTSTAAKTHVRDPPLCTSIDGSIRPFRGIRRPQPASRPECGKPFQTAGFHSFRRNLDPIIRSSRPCPWIRPLRRPATGPVSMATYLIALSDRFETGIARINPGCHRAAQHIFYSCPCNVAPLKTRGPMTPGGNALANGRGRFASRVFMRSRTFGNALSIRQLPGGRHLPENHPQQYWIETVSTGTNRCRG